MNKMVDARQSAFLGDKNILDGIFVANEVIYEMREKKKSCLIFKANFEKAYDLVR